MICANGQVEIRVGDCRDLLRAMPDQSVNCIVTSPPYFGLRDYGTADWEGGDEGCDHAKVADARKAVATSTLGGGKKTTGHLQEGYTRVCGKCGARRIDRQLGLESSPDAFVAEMVAVFREARRVLRDDGTCWVNLGITYASRDMHPIQSHQPAHGPACDSDGTEPQGSQETGSVCRDQCGEPQDGFQTHHGHTSGSDRLDHEGASQTYTTDRDNEHPGSVSASPDASPRGVLVSTTRASFRRDRAACVPVENASASRPVSLTCGDDALAFDHTEQNIAHNDTLSGSSAGDTMGKVSSGSALQCSCGRCGICWANITIPMMNIKAKDEINIPHLVAMALQADGWYLRQTICWAKPNPMPESVRDRCTKAHEYLFLLTKSARYWYDAEAVKTRAVYPGDNRAERTDARKALEPLCADGGSRQRTGNPTGEFVNKRSVWTVATQPYSEAHFATYPPALIEPCILSGCPKGGTVLDPFGGAGTTGLVAARHHRNAILCELNPAYAEMAHKRISREWREPVAAEMEPLGGLFSAH